VDARHVPSGPVGTCAAQRRPGAIQFGQPVEGGLADAGDATAQRPAHQLAALRSLQPVGGIKQAVQQRVTVAGRHLSGACQQVAEPRRIVPQRPVGRPPAQRRLHPALVACRHLAGDLHRPRRAVGGVELHPLLGYPGEPEHGNDLIAEQRLGQLVEVRTGQHAAALDRGDQLGGDPVPAVARAQQQRDQRAGRVPRPWIPRSKLTASSWRVLEPHPHGERSSSRHSPSESPASASSSIARSPPASVRIAPTCASHDSLDRESAAARLPRDGQDSSPPMRSAGTSLQYLQVNASSGRCPWLSVRCAVWTHAFTDK
jgi:hypothetical protein